MTPRFLALVVVKIVAALTDIRSTKRNCGTFVGYSEFALNVLN